MACCGNRRKSRSHQKKKHKGAKHSRKYSYAERKAMDIENKLNNWESLAEVMFKHKKVTYYSDVADKLKISLKNAVEVCNRLVEHGKLTVDKELLDKELIAKVKAVQSKDV